ncbi:MAG TPA: phosphatase PAP2 family protein [Burkholderiaceae bacterium]|jgi:membrane-associated PAP2 superfamily phosphatase|nr:phosphatase PAP2 family protein [Burkholderiaceae bacterium]
MTTKSHAAYVRRALLISPRAWFYTGGASRAFVIFVPLALALLALFASQSGLDRLVTDLFYDASRARFPLRDSEWLELFGHRAAKYAIWIIALGILVIAFGSERSRVGDHERRAVGLALLAMALGPMIVAALKHTTGHHCPVDLRLYGGFADASHAWFVAPIDAGHCFPSGHASAGYTLFALYFLGHALDRPRLARTGLFSAIVVGTAFSAVRVVQGAHFFSHNLWAAMIDWCAAALAFNSLLRGKRA